MYTRRHAVVSTRSHPHRPRLRPRHHVDIVVIAIYPVPSSLAYAANTTRFACVPVVVAIADCGDEAIVTLVGACAETATATAGMEATATAAAAAIAGGAATRTAGEAADADADAAADSRSSSD